MAKSKRKFTTWTYVDEATNKEHLIQVYTVIEDDKVSFEAEVKTPEQFTDADENANTLKSRVMTRCVEGRGFTWVRYWLITSNKEGFRSDLFSVSGGRRHSSISFLVEDVEVATQNNGETIWRGGKHSRFGSRAKPGLPPTGKTERGECCLVEDTPGNQVSLQNLYQKFAKVANGLAGAMRDSERAIRLMASGTDGAHWKDFILKGNGPANGPPSRKVQTLDSEEDPCQPANELNSENSEPSVDARSVLPTASINLVT